jgi:hypothetical protein
VAELGTGRADAVETELLVDEGSEIVEEERVDKISVAPLLATMFSRARTTVCSPCCAVIVVVQMPDPAPEAPRLVEAEALRGDALMVETGSHTSVPRVQTPGVSTPL